MPILAATRVPDLDTARPGIRFVVILGHAVVLSSLWIFGWLESLRPPDPPPLQVKLLASAAADTLEKAIDKPIAVPPAPQPEEIIEPLPAPSETADLPSEAEEIPDINVDELLPPPDPMPATDPPQPAPPPAPLPDPLPREPEIAEVSQPPTPIPKPKPAEPKPVPPVPKPKAVPKPKPVPPQPKTEPVPPKPTPPTPLPEKKPTAAELEAERIARIQKGLVKAPEVRPAPKIAALPPGSGKGLSAKDYEARISAQIRSSVSPAIVAGTDPAATVEQTQDFYNALAKLLYGMWHQPSRMEVGSGLPTVRVALTILANGAVQSARIVRPSQVPAMDGSVEAVLRRLSRAPSPSAYGNLNPSVTIEVAFELQDAR